MLELSNERTTGIAEVYLAAFARLDHVIPVSPFSDRQTKAKGLWQRDITMLMMREALGCSGALSATDLG